MKANWRYYVGAVYSAMVNYSLSRRFLPLARWFPRGSVWTYDLQRFARTRDLRVIFDVGANVGQTTRHLLRYFPDASIYAFEPVTTSFRQLQDSFGARKNVTLSRLALGSHAHTAAIALHADSELNTFVTDFHREGMPSSGVEEVSVSTIDLFCETHAVPHIDVLKMDVQGWEMNVLDGANRLLEHDRIRFVYSEVAFRREDRDMQQFTSLNERLGDLGFYFCGLYDEFRWGESKPYVGFASALYMNPRFASRDA